MEGVRHAVLVLGLFVTACSAAVAPPAERRVVVVEGTVCTFLQPLAFPRGERASVTTEVLDQMAVVFRREPREIRLVELAGHASNDEEHPNELSRARAEWVRDELVRRGVDGARLRARGYGELCPLAPENASQNRRVEAKIVETASGPTGVELGCPAASDAGAE